MYYRIVDGSGSPLYTGYNATSIKQLGGDFLSLQQGQYEPKDERRFRKALRENDEEKIKVFIYSEFGIEESEEPFEELENDLNND